MLSAPQRLRRKKDFQQVYKSGKTLNTAFFRVKTVVNRQELTRFGVVVSNKVIKKAVDRNRKKRQIRAVLRNITPTIISGYDIVLIAQQQMSHATFQQLENDIITGFQKIHFIKQ